MSRIHKYLEQYSIINLRQAIVRTVEEYSYTALSRASGVSRSTLYKLVDGTFGDTNLSTAHKIMVGVVKLKYQKKFDNV